MSLNCMILDYWRSCRWYEGDPFTAPQLVLVGWLLDQLAPNRGLLEITLSTTVPVLVYGWHISFGEYIHLFSTSVRCSLSNMSKQPRRDRVYNRGYTLGP